MTTSKASKFPPTYMKAVVAFISTLLAQLGALMADGSTTFASITDGQWVAIASATFLSTAAVYGLGNGKDPDPSTSTPDVTPADYRGTDVTRGGFHSADSTDAGYTLVEVGVFLVLLAVAVVIFLHFVH